MNSQPPVFLISGPSGAGKSSIAAGLMRRFERGIHISVDDLREMVVSGIAHPVPQWTDETTRQFRLARRSAVAMARLYHGAGFAVAIDDVMYPEETNPLMAVPLSPAQVVRVVLLPAVSVALRRNTERTTKQFDPQVLNEPILAMHAALSERPWAAHGWTIIDNSLMTIEQTVDAILALASDAPVLNRAQR